MIRITFLDLYSPISPISQQIFIRNGQSMIDSPKLLIYMLVYLSCLEKTVDFETEVQLLSFLFYC